MNGGESRVSVSYTHLFVAAVIKLIAYAADSFDFYSSHRLELLRLRRWRQHRQKVERLVRQIPIVDEDALGDSREDYSRGIDLSLIHI